VDCYLFLRYCRGASLGRFRWWVRHPWRCLCCAWIQRLFVPPRLWVLALLGSSVGLLRA
jgi:hypothetical protein